ncbi:MAG: LPXTG cell wall anchor domain-containing protein [Lentimicrobiaceae bacterium]|nr:LPXTG cell wall anchor domain-containing protein [Lentimicrobiaceae bacterium]
MESNNNLNLILIITIAVLLFYFWRKKRKNNEVPISQPPIINNNYYVKPTPRPYYPPKPVDTTNFQSANDTPTAGNTRTDAPSPNNNTINNNTIQVDQSADRLEYAVKGKPILGNTIEVDPNPAYKKDDVQNTIKIK